MWAFLFYKKLCESANLNNLNQISMKNLSTLKTPITYWGGKQMMLKHLLPIIPEHMIYNEPFFGGGALFFAKSPAKIEFINDISGEVINFYKVIKQDFESLKKEIECTLHSEFQHSEAKDIYFNSKNKDAVIRAWAVFVLSHQSMFASFGNSWKVSKERNMASQFNTKKENFTNIYVKRLENTSIFCRDALKVITATDTPDTLHYIDPPYINTEMGHYKGYTKEDFIKLLELLSTIKGKFILSTFPSDILDEYCNKNMWLKRNIIMQKSAGFSINKKVEVITINYLLP